MFEGGKGNRALTPNVFDTLTSSAHMELIWVGRDSLSHQSECVCVCVSGGGHRKPSSAQRFILDSVSIFHSGEFPEEQLGLVFSALERFEARH